MSTVLLQMKCQVYKNHRLGARTQNLHHNMTKQQKNLQTGCLQK